jgi:hypothetical protein
MPALYFILALLCLLYPEEAALVWSLLVFSVWRQRRH